MWLYGTNQGGYTNVFNMAAYQNYCFDPANLALGTTGGPSGAGQISYPDLATFANAIAPPGLLGFTGPPTNV